VLGRLAGALQGKNAIGWVCEVEASERGEIGFSGWANTYPTLSLFNWLHGAQSSSIFLISMPPPLATGTM